MKKQILSMIIIFVMIIALLPAVSIANAATTSGIFDYEIVDSKATITKYTGTATELEIPSQLGGYPVTAIGANSFENCTTIQSVTVPYGVTSIGEYAFHNCPNLETINLPDGITSIGKNAFHGTKYYGEQNNESHSVYIGKYLIYVNWRDYAGETFTIKDGTCLIANEAFKSVRIKNLTIPQSVAFIGNNAFYNCSYLESVEISEGVVTIGDYAFQDCLSLTSVTIPDSVTTIGSEAFNGCAVLTSITIGDNVINMGENPFFNTAYYGDESNWQDGVLYIDNYLIDVQETVSSCTIKEGTVMICAWAFNFCENLSTITIPDSVERIGMRAFRLCSNLRSVKIGSGVTTIASNAFQECESLSRVYISDIAKWCEIDFENAKSNPLYYALRLYLNNRQITDLVIPDSVISIGNYAFYNCALNSVSIPDTIKSIGTDAFYGCTASSVYITDIANWCGIDFANADSNPFDKYLYLDKQLVTSLSIPEDVTKINDYAFYGCSVTSVDLGKTIKAIGENAFSRSNITALTIPSSVTKIGKSVFYECYSLATVTIEEGVQSIDDNAFAYCSALKTLTIPKSVTSIHEFAFDFCDNIENIYFGGTEEEYTKMPFVPYADNMHFSVIKNESTGKTYTSVQQAITNALSGETITLIGQIEVEDITISEGVILDLNGNTLTADRIVSYTGSAIIDNSEDKSGRLYIDKSNAIFAKDNPQLAVYDNENGCFAFAEIKTKSSDGSDRFRLDLDENTGLFTYSVSPVFGESKAARTLIHQLLKQTSEQSGVSVEIVVSWKNGDDTEERRYKYSDSTVKSIVNSFNQINYGSKFAAIFKWADITDVKSAKISTVISSDTNIAIQSEILNITVE